MKITDAAEAMVNLERLVAAVKGQEEQESKFAKALGRKKGTFRFIFVFSCRRPRSAVSSAPCRTADRGKGWKKPASTKPECPLYFRRPLCALERKWHPCRLIWPGSNLAQVECKNARCCNVLVDKCLGNQSPTTCYPLKGHLGQYAFGMARVEKARQKSPGGPLGRRSSGR
jgi:hypothetical protein